VSALILVIDDDPLTRLTIAALLEDAGYAVIAAENGEEGLALVAKHRPQLVITDMVMPRMEGSEAIRAIKRDHAEVRILAISGGGRIGNADFITTALELGADAGLAKPFGFEELDAAVRQCLAG
jgi:CheY-like chemotaxis protein